MDGTAISRIAELALGGAEVITTIGDVEFTPRELHAVRLPPEPEPETLQVHTLSGIADYVRENKDGITLGECLLVVEDVDKVALVGAITGPHRQRFEYARAECFRRSTFQYGNWYDVETFIIHLLSQFEASAQRADVMKIVGNVADENVVKQTDNGFGQTVNVKSSIGLESVPVPNPVHLAPYRTFPDVQQPESPFVLRVKKGGQGGGVVVALFEGDGGAWRVEAVKRIKRWLEHDVPGVAVIA